MPRYSKAQAPDEGHLELSDPLNSAIAAAATSSSLLPVLPPKMKLPAVSTLAPAATHACAVAALTPPSTWSRRENRHDGERQRGWGNRECNSRPLGTVYFYSTIRARGTQASRRTTPRTAKQKNTCTGTPHTLRLLFYNMVSACKKSRCFFART